MLWAILFALGTLELVQVAQGQISRQFPNLFRGGRRPEKDDKGPLLAIQLVSETGKANISSNNFNLYEEGFIRLDPDVWNQEEIEIQLFQSDSSRFRFRQSPSDQSIPDIFYGIMGVEGDDDVTDSISLYKTKVTTSRIPVVTGSIHLQGNLYQIQQLPSGDLYIGRRGLDADFDEELEFEDDDADARVSLDEPGNIDTLEVDFPWDRRRLQIVPDQSSNSSSHFLHPADAMERHRLLLAEDDGSQLDIMIIYTKNAMCAAALYPNSSCEASASNKATIEGIIELAVKETNEAFAASGILTKLRLVKLHYEDKYDDTATSWSDVFSHFTGTADGHMDYIHPMRDQYGADFVSIIVNTRGFCGSAHRPRIPSPDRAFSMVRWDCATGHYTFTHELAHTLGCRHDRESTMSEVKPGEIEPGDFNFGFQHTQTTGNRFRTLMAYNCPDGGCQRILRFSNPNMSRQGIPFGTPLADNARFIRERLHIYANFRPSVVLTLPNPQLAAAPPASDSVAAYSRKTKRLQTVPYPGSLIGAAGNMFELVAKTHVKITGFSVTTFAATTAVVEVYKLNNPGSFVGEEYNPDAWTLIGSATLVTIENKPTPLPPGTIDPVIMKQATTQAFYVTFQADTNYNRYSRASQFGDIHAQNDDLQFKVGYTANYPFEYHPKAPRIFNGEIFYELLTTTTGSPTTAPTSSTPRVGLTGTNKVFQTTFASNNGYAGNLFTIQTKTNIVVDTFDLNAGSKGGLELKIFTKFGDFDNTDVDPSSNWIEICHTLVDGKGESVPTHVPAQVVKSVAINANDRQSFYITFNGPFMRYTSALLDPNYLGNEHVALVASAGTQFPYKGYFANRIWNGNIYYRTENGSGADIQGRDAFIVNATSSGGQPKPSSYGAVEGRNPP